MRRSRFASGQHEPRKECVAVDRATSAMVLSGGILASTRATNIAGDQHDGKAWCRLCRGGLLLVRRLRDQLVCLILTRTSQKLLAAPRATLHVASSGVILPGENRAVVAWPLGDEPVLAIGDAPMELTIDEHRGPELACDNVDRVALRYGSTLVDNEVIGAEGLDEKGLDEMKALIKDVVQLRPQVLSSELMGKLE